MGFGLGDYEMPSMRAFVCACMHNCVCHILTCTFMSHSFMNVDSLFCRYFYLFILL